MIKRTMALARAMSVPVLALGVYKGKKYVIKLLTDVSARVVEETYKDLENIIDA